MNHKELKVVMEKRKILFGTTNSKIRRKNVEKCRREMFLLKCSLLKD